SFTGADGHTYGFSSVAADNAGNVQPTPTSAQASTTINLGAPPVVDAHANVTVEATGPSGAAVDFAPATAHAALGITSLKYFEFYATGPQRQVQPGDTFSLGTHTITTLATDAAGNVGTGTFTITVQDTTAPVLTL